MAIMHRKNSMGYKTQNGARLGDLFISLIQTCRLCGANPRSIWSPSTATPSKCGRSRPGGFPGITKPRCRPRYQLSRPGAGALRSRPQRQARRGRADQPSGILALTHACRSNTSLDLFSKFERAFNPHSLECREAESGFNSLAEQLYRDKISPKYCSITLSSFRNYVRHECRLRMAKGVPPFPCISHPRRTRRVNQGMPRGSLPGLRIERIYRMTRIMTWSTSI